MIDEANNLNEDVRRRIDAHLDAIDKALTACGMSRSERGSITDDVEAQILEMLSARAGPSQSLADVEAVLAELDPPEAYAGDAAVSPPTPARPTPEPARPRFSRLAILGAVCTCPFFVFFVILVSRLVASAGPHVVPARGLSIMPFLVLTAPFTILGMISISQIRHSAGRLYGMGLALFDAILFPLLLLDVLIIGLCYSQAESRLGLNPGVIIAVSILLCLIVDFLLVRWAWRLVNRPHPAATASGRTGP